MDGACAGGMTGIGGAEVEWCGEDDEDEDEERVYAGCEAYEWRGQSEMDLSIALARTSTAMNGRQIPKP